ncbi:MAG: gamma-glutamyl-gamma-aminobutyrate hydrolase family protein [Acidobacteria bacterium]|nr:gamma-glutamyl-gamma-aminobutyrate hydrolase family protein [Acidobacteriota bacterium]
MPLIAIAKCSKLHDYEESVRRAGGEPWVLDLAADRPADVVARAGGLLLTSGGDVHPSLYGEAPHPTFSAAEPGRDAYEIELVRRALEAHLPIFAICRGIQLLNVARGGTLVQDIPSQLPGALKHKREGSDQPFTLAHEVWLESGSLLETLMRDSLSEGESCQVNSRHHQAIDATGEGLVTVATAPDGVIEAVEDPSRRFCLAVQWHPENFYRTGEFRALFEGFVKAATR